MQWHARKVKTGTVNPYMTTNSTSVVMLHSLLMIKMKTYAKPCHGYIARDVCTKSIANNWKAIASFTVSTASFLLLHVG